MTNVESPSPAARVRAAASLIVLRDSDQGPQVLLLRRAEKPGDQNSGAVVFPGGLLDDADRGHYDRCDGLDDAAASARLGLPEHGLHYAVAAVRECFEEAGLLFAHDAAGAMVQLDGRDAAALAALRHALHAGELGMDAVCDRLGVRLAMGELAYHSHWITPLGMPKIFDTRFFVARAPQGQTARHDTTETVELLWLTPAQALDKARGFKLMNVTQRTLQQLAAFPTVQAALDAARAQAQVPMIRPRIARGPQGRTVVNPGDWAYAEVGRLDPTGQGQASIELAPFTPTWLSPRVLRVTAPNGSLMTGPGTNAYFVGTPGGSDWVLIDPGPDDAAHVQALRDAAPGPVSRILCTHTHKDHSPAAAPLQAHWGARTLGRVADHPEWQDASFQPDQVVADGDRITVGDGVTLRALHTPGHASNHVCWLLEEEKLLFTGDHLMQGSTVVINPPDGDMAVYLRSLERLLDEDLEWLAPGHGFLIERPHDEVRKTVAHRLAREAMIVDDLRRHGPAAEPDMVARVYAATPKALHAMALRSLRAHLQKLDAEQRARVDADGRWRLRG
ncbi:MAG: MBL fold metallo-hydrolase [Rubrivivax sp.]